MFDSVNIDNSRGARAIVQHLLSHGHKHIAIITGAGDRFFSPGWDLKAATAGEESDSDWGAGGFAGLNYPRNLNKPIIAAVNGWPTPAPSSCGGASPIMSPWNSC